MCFEFTKFNDSDTVGIKLELINSTELYCLADIIDDTFKTCSYSIRENKSVVAFIQLTVYQYSNDILWIDLFEVIKKKQGTGKKIMDQIKLQAKKKDFKYLACNPIEESKDFFIRKCCFYQSGEDYLYNL